MAQSAPGNEALHVAARRLAKKRRIAVKAVWVITADSAQSSTLQHVILNRDPRKATVSTITNPDFTSAFELLKRFGKVWGRSPVFVQQEQKRRNRRRLVLWNLRANKPDKKKIFENYNPI